MEILDIDMQMVRDALKDAPEFAKGHFENLLSEYEKVSALCEDLRGIEEERDALKDEVDDLRDENESLQSELNDRGSDHVEVLTAVKYWMHDALVLHKPITDPRKILRVVEEALEC